ncbi:MAG: aminoacyl-tRNA hydrolase [Parvularculaceae bacterium]|nr:aminoacyl-tRNA hydrolase [Parvularculaceae bacterium]
MLLLVGLGNPGEKYRKHRHNVGFMAVDAIADAHNFSAPRAKFQGEIREGEFGGEKAIALKPGTFMNESGIAVGAAMRFFKLSLNDVIVFHDELDLAAGKVKVKSGGGNAGHNGLRSIDEHIGNEFRRVRIGIGHPGDKQRVTGYVLGDFARADYDWLDPLLGAMTKSAEYLVKGDARFATALAHELAPARPVREKREPKPETQAAQTRAPAPDTQAAPPANAMTKTLQKLFGKKDGKR